jgi:hypothetical protein
MVTRLGKTVGQEHLNCKMFLASRLLLGNLSHRAVADLMCLYVPSKSSVFDCDYFMASVFLSTISEQILKLFN